MQAAFVDFGKSDMVLSFNDIQSDYYQLPQSDLEQIKKEELFVKNYQRKSNLEKNLKGENELKISDPVEKIDDENKEKHLKKNFLQKDIKFKK